MKKLTIEEKAKAYDEAIERARGEYAKFEGMLPGDVLEDVFPELKESIDERIKKVIKQVLYESTTEKDECYLDNGVTQQEVFAWLKKQGERGINGNKREIPNSVWSEEDEKKRTLLISILEVNHPNGYFKANPANTLNMEAMPTEELVSWLKDLKERVQPQPKQEWSEEDENFFKTALWHISYSISNGKSTDIHCDTTDWLKSLKYRYTWFPSSEQIKVLNEVLNFAANHESPHWNDYIFGTLNNLIRQLKKLKE